MISDSPFGERTHESECNAIYHRQTHYLAVCPMKYTGDSVSHLIARHCVVKSEFTITATIVQSRGPFKGRDPASAHPCRRTVYVIAFFFIKKTYQFSI